METRIQGKLNEIEKSHGVKILYACETGSRAWGFPSPDSDFDVRMIYRHELDWYLSLSDKKDSIEFMSSDGELDITGWDIKKCLKLMLRSNGALLERVQSPIVYRNEDNISALLKEYSERCFAPIAAMHHYLGMAKNSFSDIDNKEEIRLKTLFYALRASLACKWIREKGTVPPIVFLKMVEGLDFDISLKDRIRSLVTLKSGKNESYIHYAEKELSDFIGSEILSSGNIANTLRGRKEKNITLDPLFREIIKA